MILYFFGENLRIMYITDMINCSIFLLGNSEFSRKNHFNFSKINQLIVKMSKHYKKDVENTSIMKSNKQEETHGKWFY